MLQVKNDEELSMADVVGEIYRQGDCEDACQTSLLNPMVSAWICGRDVEPESSLNSTQNNGHTDIGAHCWICFFMIEFSFPYISQ